MTEPEVTLPELRAVDLFDDLSDEELGEWLPVTTVRRLEAGDVIAELGQQPRGLQLLLEGEADLADGGARARGARRPPARAHLDGRDRGPDRGSARGPDARRHPGASGAVPAEDFRRLAYSQPTVHRRVMQQVAPVMRA